MVSCAGPFTPTPSYLDLEQRLAEAEADCDRLTTVCNESNAVCACGCANDEHESYGEDGESCGHDDHECVRTSLVVSCMLRDLRADRDALREDRAFLLEMLANTIKTGTRDPRLDARLSEVVEDFGRALAASEGVGPVPDRWLGSDMTEEGDK